MFEFRFFEIYRSEEYLSLLLDGILVTSSLTIASSIAAFLIAILIAAVRFWQIAILAQLLTYYVEFIRNTPLIVQLFFFAFGLPALLSYVWPFWCHALLALTVNFSGYFSAILYSGFLKTPTGQIEAAKSIGLRKWIIFRKVILPQTLRSMYPSLCSQFIFVFLTISSTSFSDFIPLSQTSGPECLVKILCKS